MNEKKGQWAGLQSAGYGLGPAYLHCACPHNLPWTHSLQTVLCNSIQPMETKTTKLYLSNFIATFFSKRGNTFVCLYSTKCFTLCRCLLVVFTAFDWFGFFRIMSQCKTFKNCRWSGGEIAMLIFSELTWPQPLIDPSTHTSTHRRTACRKLTGGNDGYLSDCTKAGERC